MTGQMIIFDYMYTPDINDISEEEAVKLVGERIGVKFTWNPVFEMWLYKKGRLRLNMNYDRFVLDDNKDLFLGVGWDYGTSGGGSPCSGIDDAVEYFQRVLERSKQKTR